MSSAELLAPYTHVAGLKSKNLRDAFIDAANDVIGAGATHVNAVKIIVAKLHNASLLIDDIEDSATRRRGQPAAHLIFGTPLTMNAANMVIFEALGDCLALDQTLANSLEPKSQPRLTAVSVFQSEVALLHHGQGQDIFWRDTNQCPTADEYRTMVVNKTGGLFRLAVRLLFLDAATTTSDGAERALVAFTDDVSYFFQILDDLLNLCSSDYHEKKTYCEDLSEGKFSFPTIHSIRAAQATGDTRLLRLLQTRPQEVDVKQFCLRLMSETGTFPHTRETLACIGDRCLRQLAAVGEKAATTTDAVRQMGGSRDGDDCSPVGENAVRLSARLRSFVDRLVAAVPAKDPAV